MSGAPGKVYLVGAGPGDPALLTLRGAAVLGRADAVVYDALVDPETLALARADALRFDVGKRGHADPPRVQDETNDLLVRLAREGKTVVRLKGGDPFVFGRGGEEASALAAAGVPFEVVPGVSAAISAPAYAGIPVTDRRHAASFTVVTGHNDPSEPLAATRWGELARGADTLVVLMGRKNLPGIVARLLEHGRPADTPAAAIAWASTPEQRVVEARLADLPDRVREAAIEPPATVVVGDVVRLRATLDWFAPRPLAGRRVLVTRSEEQAGALVRALERAGAEVVSSPMIRIAAPDDAAPLDRALADLDGYDVLLFTSANAVRALAARAKARGLALAAARARVVCVGPATAAAAREAGLAPSLAPAQRFDATGLLDAILAAFPVAGLRFLVPRAEAARDVLPDGLRRAGAVVDAVTAYRTVPADVDVRALRARLVRGEIDALTFTSPSTVRHFVACLDDGARAAAARCAVAAIGPVTAAALQDARLRADAVAERAAPGALAAAVALALAARRGGHGGAT